MVDVLDLSINVEQLVSQGGQAQRSLDQIARAAMAMSGTLDQMQGRFESAGQTASRAIPRFRGIMEALQIGQNVRSLSTDFANLSNPLANVGEVASNVAQNVLLMGVNFRQFAVVAGPGAAIAVGLTAIVGLLASFKTNAQRAAEETQHLVQSSKGLSTAYGPDSYRSAFLGIRDTFEQQVFKRSVTDMFDQGKTVPASTLANYIPELQGMDNAQLDEYMRKNQIPYSADRGAQKDWTNIWGLANFRQPRFGTDRGIGPVGMRRLLQVQAYQDQNSREGIFLKDFGEQAGLAGKTGLEGQQAADILKYRNAFGEGQQKIEDWIKETDRFKDLASRSVQFGEQIGASLSQAFDITNLKNWHQTALSVLQSVAQAAQQAFITKPLADLFGNIAGSLVGTPSRAPAADRSGTFGSFNNDAG